MSLTAALGKEQYRWHHPEHLYSFSVENLKVLLLKARFEPLTVFVGPFLMGRLLHIDFCRERYSGSHSKIAFKVDSPFCERIYASRSKSGARSDDLTAACAPFEELTLSVSSLKPLGDRTATKVNKVPPLYVLTYLTALYMLKSCEAGT